MFKKIIAVALVLFLASCSSTVKMAGSSSEYKYNGEKYGKINVVLSDAVKKNSKKVVRTDELDLDGKIKSYMDSEGLYDESSPNSVNVVVNKIHVRNAFNAIMFGAMAGSDNIDGTVTLKDANETVIASFNIKASWALGGTAGGQNATRLGWLSDKFAELTAETISGESKKSKKT